MLLRRWGSESQKFGFINWVDKKIGHRKEIESWRFESYLVVFFAKNDARNVSFQCPIYLINSVVKSKGLGRFFCSIFLSCVLLVLPRSYLVCFESFFFSVHFVLFPLKSSYFVLICVFVSLRSKRFGKAFRTFDALFAFLAPGKLGREQKSAWPLTCGKPYGNACNAGYLFVFCCVFQKAFLRHPLFYTQT